MRTFGDARSLLFTPASDEGKLRRALTAAADAVIADLEDSVALRLKPRARRHVLEIFASDCGRRSSQTYRFVRINDVASEPFRADLELVASIEPDAVVVPKATARACAVLAHVGLPLVALIETAEGLAGARRIAATENVVALLLGSLDLGRELRLKTRRDGMELVVPRMELTLASALSGLRAPFDAVYPNIHDARGLEDDALRALSVGFGGKACIHPAQVAAINRVFSPSEADIEGARRIVAAYETASVAGHGATVLDGELIDLPVVLRARQLLQVRERKDTT